jgi:transcriptional regulator of aromatic amino acid metabolism
MRIKVHCQNRIGILRDILNLLVAYGINVKRGRSAAIRAMRFTFIAPI